MKGTCASGGQQRPEHRARERQVEHRERELREPDRRPRRPQRPAADLERARARSRPTARRRRPRTSSAAPTSSDQLWCRCSTVAACAGDSSSDRPEMVASPMPSERLQKAVTVATSMALMPAVAYRRKRMALPVKMAKAERVPERVGDEGGEEDARVGDQPAQVAQRQHLVGAEQPVAGAVKPRAARICRRGMACRCANTLLDVQLRELVVQDGHHDGEHQQRRERTDPAPEGPLLLLARRRSWARGGHGCAAAAVPSASAACSGCGAAARRPRPCGACSPRCSPGSCPRTRPPANRPRRRGCGSRCDRGTSDRGR